MSPGSEQRSLSLTYDAGYRITANFLNYAVQKYGADLITKLNAACRQWNYTDDFWISYTGKTLPQLNSNGESCRGRNRRGRQRTCQVTYHVRRRAEHGHADSMSQMTLTICAFLKAAI